VKPRFNAGLETVLTMVSLAGLAACGVVEAPAAPPPPVSSLDVACGPWESVRADERVGAAGLSANELFAAIAGEHVLESPEPGADGNSPGTLIVEVSAAAGGAGAAQVRMSSSLAPGAPRGGCGLKMALVGQARTTDGAIEVPFDGATFFLNGEQVSAGLSADVPDGLPEPYQAIHPLSLEVGFSFDHLRAAQAQADLRVAFSHDQVWTWRAPPAAP
jgi:hypothetical protein